MIVITSSNNSITIKGHANYAAYGKDIVCAAISALTQTMLESVEKLTPDTIKYSMSPGTVDIKFRNLSEKAQLLVDSFFIGAQMIAEAYPKSVTLTKL